MKPPSFQTGALYAMTLAALTCLGLTWWTTGDNFRLGALTVGPWTAWPVSDPQHADRYSRARIARSGDLPLGPGEGLAFTALTDSAGLPLNGRCRYRIGPVLPPARWWTLTLYGADGRSVANPSERYGFASSAVLRNGAGEATIEVSQDVRPGNWLPGPPGSFRLVMRLYDSPVSSGQGIRTAIAMPAIDREECAS